MSITEKPHVQGKDGKIKKLSDKHLSLVRRGGELTRLLKDQKVELNKINDELKAAFGPDVSIILPNEFRAPIAESITKSLSDEAGLREHLGTRKFNLLVTTNTSYKPSPTLLEMAEESEEIAEFFSDKTTLAVKYLPIKTQK